MKILRRWEPFRDFIEKFFEEDSFETFYPTKALATDVYETNENIVVEMQIPGYKKENVKVSYENGYLKVEGESQEEKEEKEKNYWRKEIKRGSFLRIIPLPKEVDSKKAKASFNDGILTIKLPKIDKEEFKGDEIKIE